MGCSPGRSRLRPLGHEVGGLTQNPLRRSRPAVAPPNLQSAVAFGLAKPESFFSDLATEMQRRRDRLSDGLRALGLTVLPAQGAYFANLDIRSTGFDGDDVAFCRHLVERVGVAAIPLSAFYEEAPVRHLARFCFAKQDAVLDEALRRMRAHFAK